MQILILSVTPNDLVYYRRVLVLIMAILLYSDFYTEGNSQLTTKNIFIIILALFLLFIIGISGTTSFAWW
jgi:membrane-bound ClpP family serine protease